MGRRSNLDIRLTTLLALLLLGASAAVPRSEQEAQTVARAALDRGDPAGAKPLIETALIRFGKRGTEAVWALRVMLGEAHLGLGESKKAGEALAFVLPPELRTSETAVRQLIMQMFATDALDFGRKARALAAAHQPAALAEVLTALANMGAKDGEQLAREAIRLARKHGRKTQEARAMATLAYVLNRQQDYAPSVGWGEQALALAKGLGLAKTVLQIEGNLGWSYLGLGDAETAAELFTAAEKSAAGLGARHERVAWLIQLGNVSLERRDWVAAERYTTQAVAIARGLGGHEQLGLALANLARIAIETRRFADARRLNAEALLYKKGDAALRSHILDARILIAEGKYADAQKRLNDVLRQTKVDMTVAEAAGELAGTYVRTKQPRLAEAQFMRAMDAARKAYDEVTDRDLRFSVSNATAEFFGEYVDFLAQSKRIDDALAVAEARRAQLLEEGLVVPQKLDARAVARQNDATILCYWLGRDRSWLWVVTKNDVLLRELPSDTTIEKATEAYSRQLLTATGTLQASGPRGEALYGMLVASAAAAIPKSSRVIVIADGRLHALNFETLVVPSPQRHYWIEDVVVMNASSLQLLARAARKPSATPSILLVGNPASADPAFPSLKYAAAEMRAIEQRFPRRAVLEGAKATPAAYKSAAPEKFDYVHFVAHGFATRKRPLDSAVILAPDATSRYKLLARDVVDQRLAARLVTISSCYGAGTRTYRGEGVVGLAWAFLRAGADQVVASLWQVNDAATPKLMDQMYAAIRAGKDPAVALREAKLQLVNGKGAYRRPFYWAPFVLYANV